MTCIAHECIFAGGRVGVRCRGVWEGFDPRVGASNPTQVNPNFTHFFEVNFWLPLRENCQMSDKSSNFDSSLGRRSYAGP